MFFRKFALFVFFLLFLFSISLSINEVFAAQYQTNASAKTRVGDPKTNSPTDIGPVPPEDQIENSIRNNFGLILKGSYNYEAMKQIYQAMATLFQSTIYASHLNSINKPVTVYLGGPSSFSNSNCTGFAPRTPGNEIHLYDLYSNGGCGYITLKYTLTHELGHIMDYRTSLEREFVNSGVFAKDGPLKTYPFTNSDSESFAEMIADYVVYKQYRFTKLGRTFPEFPQEYPNYYRFARDIIFGGLEF